jgi:hypothetical protein
MLPMMLQPVDVEILLLGADADFFLIKKTAVHSCCLIGSYQRIKHRMYLISAIN